MNKLSLFSGIGGDDLASEAAGIETVCFVERDKYCQQVLKKHWPEIPIIEDVKDVTKESLAYTISQRQLQPQGCQRELRGRTFNGGKALENTGCQHDEGELLEGKYEKTPSERSTTSLERPNSAPGNSGISIDIIAGGFPCQPHSVAGKRKGSSDERNLWPEFRRIIGEIRPRWVVAENVPGLFSSDAGRFFGEVLADLAKMGYAAGWCTFGAVDVGALHRRNRVFIVAHASSSGDSRGRGPTGEAQSLPGINRTALLTGKSGGTGGESGIMADTHLQGLQGRVGGKLPECAGQRAIGESDSPLSNTTKQGLPESRFTGEWKPETQRGKGLDDRFTVSTPGSVESRLGRMVDGLSYWLDEPAGILRVATGIKNRVNRLKGLGNAVVPQQIYPVYKAIVDIEGGLKGV